MQRDHSFIKDLSRLGLKLVWAGEGLSYETSRDVLLAALVGLATGLLASAFHWLTEAADFVSLVRGADENSFLGSWGRLILLFTPAIGAVAGATLTRICSHARGARGTDSAVYAYHRRGGHITSTAIPVKSIASAMTVGLGGSAGYEGPMTLVGAACGCTISRVLHLGIRQKRILMAAGLAAGISALFRAPLAGAIFGAEIFYSSSDMEYETILPGFVASAVAYTVFCCFFGWAPLLPMPDYTCESSLKLIPFLALALVAALGARIYICFFRGTEEFFSRRERIPFYVKVAIGGLLTGAIGFFVPQIYGVSYDVIRAAFTTHDPFHTSGLAEMSFAAFVAIFFAKVVATSCTVGSGGSGGVFAPALVCGACLGAATGVFFSRVLPEWIGINPGAFALVGMAAFTASAIRIPLASIIMVSEISGNHELLLPTMWVCAIAFWLNNGWSLYRSQVHDREASPVHGI
ncbi:MAG: chloride channel protein [Kiritimatiellae bacterium]|nr:chloride channel protein [Kiritimatiellia bacterium]